MFSEARQTANAANALRSTGPQTAEGKARSSGNARKHGLTAIQLVIAAEDREEFEELLAGLHADELAAAAWNLRRIRAMETEIVAPAARYRDILDNPEWTAKLDRLARHKTRIERNFHRSLRELKALQTDAAITLTLPALFIERALPLASRTQITKRTHGRLLVGSRLEAAAVAQALSPANSATGR